MEKNARKDNTVVGRIINRHGINRQVGNITKGHHNNKVHDINKGLRDNNGLDNEEAGNGVSLIKGYVTMVNRNLKNYKKSIQERKVEKRGYTFIT